LFFLLIFLFWYKKKSKAKYTKVDGLSHNTSGITEFVSAMDGKLAEKAKEKGIGSYD